MTCSTCGAAVQDGAKFCADCGAPVAAPCAECGAEVAPGKAFCGSCGAPVATSAPAAAVAAPAPVTAPAAIPPPPRPSVPSPQRAQAGATQTAAGRRTPQPVARRSAPAAALADDGKAYAEGKSPGTAAILSFLIPGVGQFYNGDMKKGLVFLGILLITGGFAWLILCIVAALDAYQVAKGERALWT